MIEQPIIISALDSVATIKLSEGGRIEKLYLNDIKIIDSLPISYQDSFSSSILFPFANRLKHGRYIFEGRAFQLEKNMAPHAIHGLLHDKQFIITSEYKKDSTSSISLNYISNEKYEGFPFKYTVGLTYLVSQDSFHIKLDIRNLDVSSFPFIVGWHPYFYTKDLHQSFFKMHCEEQYVVDNTMIPTVSRRIKWNDFKTLKDKKFDDGFKLLNDEVEFKTPSYHIKMSSNLDENYIQLFTPKQRNFFAIEPMSGVADSFNNKIGLKILEPKQSFEVEWKIKLL